CCPGRTLAVSTTVPSLSIGDADALAVALVAPSWRKATVEIPCSSTSTCSIPSPGEVSCMPVAWELSIGRQSRVSTDCTGDAVAAAARSQALSDMPQKNSPQQAIIDHPALSILW